MILLLRHSLAFLALPRAASTSVEAALLPFADLAATGDPRVKHMNFRRFSRFVLPLAAAYGVERVETVCLVREPVAWLASWYRYRRRAGAVAAGKHTRDLSFAAFAEAWLSDSPPAFAAVGRPSRFVAGRDGRPGVDRMFRFEALPAFGAFLSARLGRDIALPHLNAAPEEAAELPAPLAARLRDALAEDTRLWEAAEG